MSLAAWMQLAGFLALYFHTPFLAGFLNGRGRKKFRPVMPLLPLPAILLGFIPWFISANDGISRSFIFLFGVVLYLNGVIWCIRRKSAKPASCMQGCALMLGVIGWFWLIVIPPILLLHWLGWLSIFLPILIYQLVYLSRVYLPADKIAAWLKRRFWRKESHNGPLWPPTM